LKCTKSETQFEDVEESINQGPFEFLHNEVGGNDKLDPETEMASIAIDKCFAILLPGMLKDRVALVYTTFSYETVYKDSGEMVPYREAVYLSPTILFVSFVDENVDEKWQWRIVQISQRWTMTAWFNRQ